MWTRQFWADLLERSLKAAAWSVLGTLGANATGTISGVDWLAVLNIAGYTLVIAVLANLLGTKVAGLGAPDSASFLPADLDPPKRKRGDRGESFVWFVLVVAAVCAGILLAHVIIKAV